MLARTLLLFTVNCLHDCGWHAKTFSKEFIMNMLLQMYLFLQESLGSTAGPLSLRAPSETDFWMPTWCCPWIYPPLETSSWKSKPQVRPSQPCMCTPAPLPLQRAAALFTKSHRFSATPARRHHYSVCMWWTGKTSRLMLFFHVPHIWSPSGRLIQKFSTKLEDKLQSVMVSLFV